LDEELWGEIQAIAIENMALGRVSSPSDLSGSMKLLWDDSYLYLLVRVADDTTSDNNRSANERDGIEFFLDMHNNKADDYGADNFHLRFPWHSSGIEFVQGSPGNGILAQQKETPEGYLMELAFPWTALHAAPVNGQFLGIDIHINDNDGGRREAKLSWYSRRNAAYRSPRFFGTMRLIE
jgi:hypothetical protein